IVLNLFYSPIGVGDLTARNPNVYWELGVRQSLSHGTVMIAEIGTQLPFDIRDIGTLFYDPGDAGEWEGFRKQFKTALRDCLKNPDRPDSPVLEALVGRGSLYSIFRAQELARRLVGLASEIDRNSEIMEIALQYAKNARDLKDR